MNSRLILILMNRDGLSRAEAVQSVREAYDLVMDGADPEQVLFDEFGLEPDYVQDLLEAGDPGGVCC